MTFEELIQDERRRAEYQTLHRAILHLLESQGPVPDEARKKICSETDTDVLLTWLELAAHAKGPNDFLERIH